MWLNNAMLLTMSMLKVLLSNNLVRPAFAVLEDELGDSESSLTTSQVLDEGMQLHRQ